MAGNLPIGGVIQVKLTWLSNSLPTALNILHCGVVPGATPGQATANAIDTAVKAAFTSSGHAADTHTTWGLWKVSIRSLSSNENPWFDGSAGPVPGTGTGKPLPPANALVVTLSTAKRGRSFSGRVYLSGFSDVANDTTGSATGTAAANAATFVEGIGSAVEASFPGMGLVVVSRFTTSPGTTVAIERNPPIATAVESIACKDLRWDVQRRRATPGI